MKEDASTCDFANKFEIMFNYKKRFPRPRQLQNKIANVIYDAGFETSAQFVEANQLTAKRQGLRHHQ
jgi:hypothetical protein